MNNVTSMPDVKPNQIRIRIHDEDADVLDSLGQGVLSRTDVASYLLHAAVEAVRGNGGRVHMPPVLKVIMESEKEYQLNEPKKPRR